MQKVDAVKQEYALHNPKVDMAAMCAGQKVTWDCLWFENYPQTEVKSTDSEYGTLQSAEGWDENGDVVVNGVKYHRMLKGDITRDSTYDKSVTTVDKNGKVTIKVTKVKASGSRMLTAT